MNQMNQKLQTKLERAISRYDRYRHGESLNSIYSLPFNWSDTHEGGELNAKQQMLDDDISLLADSVLRMFGLLE